MRQCAAHSSTNPPTHPPTHTSIPIPLTPPKPKHPSPSCSAHGRPAKTACKRWLGIQTNGILHSFSRRRLLLSRVLHRCFFQIEPEADWPTLILPNPRGLALPDPCVKLAVIPAAVVAAALAAASSRSSFSSSSGALRVRS